VGSLYIPLQPLAARFPLTKSHLWSLILDNGLNEDVGALLPDSIAIW
jgi:hypothetical protein